MVETIIDFAKLPIGADLNPTLWVLNNSRIFAVQTY
jgi:hypothetical protein